eukprot:TRINITY_DN27239_c0_g2_i1.p1 TRINITY_DN27239_c0_g2~~TRINITY_DN27239_c0_g2_i1.p1  ORF type:complete len:180 (+),score=19.07 TRINITY_DN27239_c0_g2_i1:66-605(+)
MCIRGRSTGRRWQWRWQCVVCGCPAPLRSSNLQMLSPGRSRSMSTGTSKTPRSADDTKWLLEILHEAGCTISPDMPLKTIFADGVLLAKLIQHLTGKPVRVNTRASLPAIQLDNLAVCCKAMSAAGFGNGVVPADFQNGCSNTVIGFITRLRTKFGSETSTNSSYSNQSKVMTAMRVRE